MPSLRAVASAWLASMIVAHAAVVEAADYRGRVIVGAVPVPGATVTAARSDQRSDQRSAERSDQPSDSRSNQQRVTVTDREGVFRFADIAEGIWTLRVEMLGFVPVSRDVTIGPDAAPVTWELKLQPFAAIGRALPRPAGDSSLRTAADDSAGAGTDRSADGFLINGSVNNGAASPFAQLAAFGNNRRGGRSLYSGGVGLLLGNSAWDARPFSFTGRQTPKPSYSDMQIVGSFAGPLRIPGLVRHGPMLTLGYQRTVEHNASTQSALMPTPLERAGDFSQTRDRLGRPVQIVDPATRLPFVGSVIPPARLSPQAAALLDYYPLPNVEADRQDYQTATLVATHEDAFQSRFTKALAGGRDHWFGNLAYQRTTTDSSNLFSFVDSTRVARLDTAFNWAHRFSPLLSVRLRYQFTRVSTDVTPYFAHRTNVSGDANIGGNNQDPVNWGPPRLLFSTGLAGLSTTQSLMKHHRTQAWGGELLWSRGRHTLTVGGDIRRQQWDVISQQDARGTFSFDGAATGSDLADFLLGLPHASTIAFGNADKYLCAPAYGAYVTDDWRVNPTLTVNAGVRWEYEAPVSERGGRLVNLDLTPRFAAASPVVGTNPLGTLTGRRYPEALIAGDWRGVQPRVGVAWRPVAGSSLVVRAGYGIYRNSSIYEPIALLLAQQPPLSNASSVETSAVHTLTLANGFAPPGSGTNTFAVDPDLRVGSAHNWQILVQRDLPASLTMTATYLGTKGSHLLQESLPNTVPLGAVNPCPACPAGFVYLTSNGRSKKHTGQLQLRRRLRNGLTSTVQYALSTATDDAGAFTGVRMDGAAIAQDWQDLDAEHGRSDFDQRYRLTMQVQYTTGAGVGGGARLDGMRKRLFSGWTVTGGLTAGSGLPLTPVLLTSVAGTGVTGTIRPDLTGSSPDAAPPGLFLNPAAYAVPSPGRWGTAGRNSVSGPRQFALDASLGRSFLLRDRLTLDWRIDATNVLNRVTYAGVNAIVGSPQFGLPTLANPMRKVQSSLRVRF